MKKRVGAAFIGFMLVMSGCGAAPETAAPVSVSPSPSVAASATPAPAVQTATPTAAATPAAATTAPATPEPTASSTPQPSAAAATPSAAAATAAPVVSATAKPTPVPAPTPAPASAAPTPSEKPQATDAGVTTAAQAQALFKDNCMSCHGAGLEGDFGPNLTKVGSRKTKDEIVQQINKGSGDMPPFQKALKAEEIETLAAWLAAKK